LSAYDPTTYFLLLQFRVVVTGVVFQILFSKRLSRIQWISLILLTIGCIIKQMNYTKVVTLKSTKLVDNLTQSTPNIDDYSKYINVNLFLIMIQVFTSCFAGVYNEYILKEKTNNVHIMLQNVFMYLDSIVCNVLLLILYNDGKTNNGIINAFSYKSMVELLDLKVILIIINNASIGIVTSLFLKSLNSILKTFASALELMFTAVLAWIIFGIPLDVSTVIAIFIVSFATWLYSKNPVQNTSPQSQPSQSDSKTQLSA
jgi:solute carrier family 35 (UDP-sugar transporter), member A1/2/3